MPSSSTHATDPQPERRAPLEGQEIAAVDLGSNSFHVLIARAGSGDFKVIDRLREPVRIAGGLDAHERLSDEAQAAALECLARFGQRLAHIAPDHVRVVGTDALRRARNGKGFLSKAAKALGHSIEILPGREEARLIYLGVAHDLPDAPGRQLVVDIGGGSTECILGEGREPLEADSLSMGCVGFSKRFFAGGEVTRDAFRAAEIAAGSELQTLQEGYVNLGWERAVGASGTITTTAEVLRGMGLYRDAIELEALKRLRKELIERGKSARLELEGLSPDRRAVYPAGLAILRAVFDAFGLERMQVATASIREGVLLDLCGRFHHDDAREHAVRRLAERWGVDREHAARVERTALALWRAAARDWKLDGEPCRRMLSWAARLHELGLAVSYSGHHKHGAYLIANGDLPGFSREERSLLATLVQGSRRSLSKALFRALEDGDAEPQDGAITASRALRLCVVLRLAVLLHRSRGPQPLPALRCSVAGSSLELLLPADWLAAHPLTLADLEEEARVLREVDFRLALA
ncbi:MAG: Ppx/GppA family phosphatase [Planctomycetota bacterium]|nr:MAG: Ppx/GppA family phosphatase [Planctomycetota bacterium]